MVLLCDILVDETLPTIFIHNLQHWHKLLLDVFLKGLNKCVCVWDGSH